MTMMPPATEAPAPLYTGAPADQQPQDLQGSLAIVDSILWRDGGMDPQEQQIFFAWVQQTIMKIEAQNQMAAQGQGADASGLGSSSATQEYNPNGGGANAADAENDFYQG